MRRLGQAAGRAFTESMSHEFNMEKDLASFLEYNFKVNGCDTSAFVPVVAGGPVSRSFLFMRGWNTNRSRMRLAFITPEMMMS